MPCKVYKTLQFNRIKGHNVNMLNEIIKQVNGICTECMQESLIFDQTHDIIYCTKCGLVTKDNQAPLITQLMEEADQEDLERKTIMRKLRKQQHNEMLILNKYGNYLFNQYFFMFW